MKASKLCLPCYFYSSGKTCMNSIFRYRSFKQSTNDNQLNFKSISIKCVPCMTKSCDCWLSRKWTPLKLKLVFPRIVKQARLVKSKYCCPTFYLSRPVDKAFLELNAPIVEVYQEFNQFIYTTKNFSRKMWQAKVTLLDPNSLNKTVEIL